MKRSFFICLFALTLSAALIVIVPVNQTFAQNKSAESKAADPNSKVIVTVNGEDINEGTMKKAVPLSTDTEDSPGHKISQTYIDEQRSDVLEDMITNTIVLQQFKKNKVEVSDADVNSYIVQMLATIEPPMNMDDLRKKIEEQGMSIEQWKEGAIKNRLLMTKLLEIKYPDQLKTTDEDAKKYYDSNLKNFQKPEQVRASHILVRFDRKDPNKLEQNKAAAKKKAQDILDKIRKGADFNDIAKQYSEDPGTAQTGGDLGYFDRTKMIKEFSDAAFNLKPGQVSDIVESTYGYHIIKVTDHRDAMTIPFEKIKLNLIDNLKSKKIGEIIGGYITKIKDEATIVYPSDSYLRPYKTSKTQIRQPSMPTGPVIKPQASQGTVTPPK